MPVIRTFIAVDLSPDILTRLDSVSGSIEVTVVPRSVRWVPSRNIHLTLQYLGDVSTANLDLLQILLKSKASQYLPFEISVGETGAFPSVQRPRVIWVGVQAPSQLFDLQKEIEKGIEDLGYGDGGSAQDERKKSSRSFSPHLTIGRVSRSAGPAEVSRISSILKDLQVGFLGVTRIEAVYLYKSDLRPGGAVYTRLYSAPLQT